MTMQSPDPTSAAAIAETAVGGVLTAAPLWMRYLVEVNVVLATVTGICGAIIAIVGVWRILNRKPGS